MSDVQTFGEPRIWVCERCGKDNYENDLIDKTPEGCIAIANECRVIDMECPCGWKGTNEELRKAGSATHADTWWECPKCGLEAAKMKRRV
jgi:ribosomal protein L37E